MYKLCSFDMRRFPFEFFFHLKKIFRPKMKDAYRERDYQEYAGPTSKRSSTKNRVTEIYR